MYQAWSKSINLKPYALVLNQTQALSVLNFKYWSHDEPIQGLGLWCLMPFQQYFSYIVVVELYKLYVGKYVVLYDFKTLK
jgi:hypothetical protein